MSAASEFAGGVADGARQGLQQTLKSKRAPLAFATVVFAFIFWLAMNNRITLYADLARRSK